MNIEELISHTNIIIEEGLDDDDDIQLILKEWKTAYEKEKEENLKLRLQNIPLIEGELKAYKDRVNELKAELEKEKEKNKELIKQHAIEITDVDGNSIRIDLDGKIHNVYKVKEE